MRLCAVWAVAAGLLLAASARGDDVKKELEKFEGAWVPVSAERNGNEIPRDMLEDMKLVFKGDKFTVTRGKRTIEGTFKVYPAKKPRAYDATAGEENRRITTLGIYEFDREMLKVCYVQEGGERPKEFSSKGGTEKRPIILTVYKRQKP